MQSFLNYFRGTAPTFCSDLMAAVQHVDAQQVRRSTITPPASPDVLRTPSLATPE